MLENDTKVLWTKIKDGGWEVAILHRIDQLKLQWEDM